MIKNGRRVPSRPEENFLFTPMRGTRAVVTPRTFSRHKKRAHPKGKSFPCKSATASLILGRQTITSAGSPSTSTNQTSFSCSNGPNDLDRCTAPASLQGPKPQFPFPEPVNIYVNATIGKE